jgi:hypothetical protein
VITFEINGFRRRVDPMGRIIGDDCLEDLPITIRLQVDQLARKSKDTHQSADG